MYLSLCLREPVVFSKILTIFIFFKRNPKAYCEKIILIIYNVHKLEIRKIEYLYKLQFIIAISGNMIYN